MNELIKFENEYGYGTLVLETITEYMPVKDIHSSMVSEEFRFNFNIAGQIALITNNRKIQMGLIGNTKLLFIIHHKSCSIAAICRIKELNYTSSADSMEEIERLANASSYCNCLVL